MIRPHNDWILVDRPRSPNMIGSIHLLTMSGRVKPEYGTVVAVGPGRRKKCGEREPVRVSIGQKVTFRRFDIEKLKGIPELEDDNGNPYIFIRDRDLWSVIEPEEKEIFTVRTVSER